MRLLCTSTYVQKLAYLLWLPCGWSQDTGPYAYGCEFYGAASAWRLSHDVELDSVEQCVVVDQPGLSGPPAQ